MSSADPNPELESFREEWKAEVQSRHSQPQQHAAAGPSTATSRAPAQTTQPSAPQRRAPLTEPPRQPAQPVKKPKVQDEDDDDDGPSLSFDEPAAAAGTALAGQFEGLSMSEPSKEPETALEHYEKAVERESAGNHGDSIRLYRKAFRQFQMDHKVDQKYKNKHFPKSAFKAAPAPASDSATPAPRPEKPLSMKQLIASYSTSLIEPAPPETEEGPELPCPIASIPNEILIHIMRDVAVADVGDFVRLSLVCKRLAYLVATEDRIWRRVCLGTEFGFGGMHYHWQRQITWEPLTDEDLASEATKAAAPSGEAPEGQDEIRPPLTLEERCERLAREKAANTLAFHSSLYSSSWLRMFRLRPRIRFNGCYISTVNYVRTGERTTNTIHASIGPVHIVTFYRYIRFFRDGTCISLVTTTEPAEVVHHLTRETVELHAGPADSRQGRAAARLPTAFMQSALKGRWRLDNDKADAPPSEIEGDLVVETEGVSTLVAKIYDLDTLDTRFTTPSGVPYRAIVDSREVDKREKQLSPLRGAAVEESRWGTPEFWLYSLVIAVALPAMFWVAYDVSRPSDPRYHRYEAWLSPGWIPGRKIDNSDAQYRTFRMNMPYMAALLVFHPLLRRAWNAINPLPKNTRDTPAEVAESRFRQRTSFDYAFALLFLVILHGFSAFKILFILALNYKIGTTLPRKYIPAATWIFNICTLFANELGKGYKYRSIALLFAGETAENSVLVKLGELLDSYGGIMKRWEVLFNITVLRLVSFNLDYYWSIDRRSSSPIEKQLDPANLSERDRIAIPANPSDYSFRNFVGYAIYAPLYLTGPIITFNDYISQSRYRPATIESSRTWKYALRFLLVLLAMELVLHYDYIGAISKTRPEWSTYTPAQISLLSYFNLHIIWLKLLLPWRFFRLWALTDGIDPPENMLRCVSNNYSTLSFWRGWHRSYYRWLLRYIYIPLGGTSFRSTVDAIRSVVTYLVVFTFVALWHDIKLNLLIWGWLIVIFFLPEIAASYAFPRKKWESSPGAYRVLCGVGGVLNVLMMMAANLVGFAFGLDGLQSIVKGIFRDYSGITFLITACCCLFVGIQIMFEIRQSELRRGINMKC
ncbi:putative glycerol transporter protein [Cladorrhinum samala]|uniref:F-box only protein 9 n=1 Tax=Cladorrhinum samala TaxID=585594 RepID=A0AAV9HFH5_9PEZI|nr:putative glycerol transporter protein [Cladorrhinum samala]